MVVPTSDLTLTIVQFLPTSGQARYPSSFHATHARACRGLAAAFPTHWLRHGLSAFGLALAVTSLAITPLVAQRPPLPNCNQSAGGSHTAEGKWLRPSPPRSLRGKCFQFNGERSAAKSDCPALIKFPAEPQRAVPRCMVLANHAGRCLCGCLCGSYDGWFFTTCRRASRVSPSSASSFSGGIFA